MREADLLISVLFRYSAHYRRLTRHGLLLLCADISTRHPSMSFSPVQQLSTATSPPKIDGMRPIQVHGLHQRPTTTSLPLVHTEEVTGSIQGRPLSSIHVNRTVLLSVRT
jgi:hypothetical protein